MAIQYVDPSVPRHIFGWRSPRLGLYMPIVTYGSSGKSILLFPTAAADFLENERFFLVKAIEPFIKAGRVRLFSIDSINAHAWMDRTVPIPEKARRQALYSAYIEEEVVPYVRQVTGDPSARSLTTGASFGAFHAANALFRRPDLFSGTIAMSGFFDLSRSYLDGYHDGNVYFNNPAYYLPNLSGEPLHTLQHDSQIVIVTGQGAFEAPHNSISFSEILQAKSIPHMLDVWGHDVRHDWPWWRKMLPYHLEKLGF